MSIESRSLDDLEHTEVSIGNGIEDSKVVVLDTGAFITAEDQAMLMALHSRDPKGIMNHLSKLAQVGSGKFMENFYVGYGHGSIGDCGNGAVFVEGVSMLVAKALQDYPLYRGQECSTRYIDFSEQPFVNPHHDQVIGEVQQDLRTFYLSSFDDVVDSIASKFPHDESEGNVKKWEKAVKARAFDILRGFLPAGASTNVAWSVDLRQARDRLLILRNHPLEEVRNTANALEIGLRKTFPNSFGEKRYPEQEEWVKSSMKDDYLLEGDPIVSKAGVTLDASRLNLERAKKYSHLLSERPSKTELPKFLDQLGVVDLGFMLDFASFRDIQRHRAVSIRMPELTTNNGFENWYMNQLPPSIHSEARELLTDVEERIKRSELPSADTQYAIPMGYKIPCSITGGLPGLTYMLELRSGTRVHPTLRAKAQEAGNKLREDLAKRGVTLALHMDELGGQFDIKRGNDDIAIK